MDYERLVLDFTSIIYEALPFIVLGVIIAGLLEEFVPQQAIARIIPGNRFLAICLGGWLGLIFPMCECGIIVVMRRLLRKGLPLSVCVSYMLAGPIVNVVVMLSTYVAFTNGSIFQEPLYVVALRVGMGFVVAVVTASFVEAQTRVHGTAALLAASVTRGLKDPNAPDEEANKGPRGWRERLNNITTTALHDFVDILAFLILGALLAVSGRLVLRGAELDTGRGVIGTQAAKEPAKLQPGDKEKKGARPAPTDQQEAKPSTLVTLIKNVPPFAILMMMLMAVLFCLCSEADAFVAANFQAIWPAASKMSFLVLGPMMDIKLYLMYTRVFRPRLILTIILAVASQVFVYSLILHYLLTGYPAQ